MKNWKSILLLLLVFLAGLAVGVVGTRIAVRRVVQQAVVHPERAQGLIERSLARKLRLDPAQQVQLHGLMTELRGQLREVRQGYQPQAAAAWRTAEEKIKAVLTPEQLARFEKFKQDRPLWRAWQEQP